MKKIKARNRIGRNELCPCGSSTKFKHCHGRSENNYTVPTRKQYIDSGETPVRWVICNDVGTAFFADKDNRVLVFADKQIAIDVIRLDLFSSAGDNEINLAGVGQTKWEHLQATLPFVEVSSMEMAAALIQERISDKTAALKISEPTPEPIINKELTDG